MIFSRYRLSSTGDKRHPWRTPTDVRNDRPTSHSCNTALVGGPYSDLSSVTSPSSMLYRRISRQSILCHTRSNAFLNDSISVLYICRILFLSCYDDEKDKKQRGSLLLC